MSSPSELPDGSDNVPTTVPPTLRRWPGWRMLFFVSLALNLLIAGALLHRAWLWRHGPPDRIAGPMMRLLHDLPPDRRAALRDAIDAVKQSLQGVRRNASSAREEAASTLTKEPFNRAEFEAALRRLMDAESNGRQGAIAPLATLAGALTPAERQSFSKQLLDRRRDRVRD